MKSWKKMLNADLAKNKESWDDVESNTMTEEEMAKEFSYRDYGLIGIPFTVWTKHRVYFPVEYDGMESVESVARNPDGKPTEHIGG